MICTESIQETVVELLSYHQNYETAKIVSDCNLILKFECMEMGELQLRGVLSATNKGDYNHLVANAKIVRKLMNQYLSQFALNCIILDVVLLDERDFEIGGDFDDAHCDDDDDDFDDETIEALVEEVLSWRKDMSRYNHEVT